MGAPFYNTARLSGQELQHAIAHAKSQEDAILLLFTNSYTGRATPSDVMETLRRRGRAWPITSVRRAMHNLTKDGSLFKTDHQQAGPYGMPEHIWQLATQPEKQS